MSSALWETLQLTSSFWRFLITIYGVFNFFAEPSAVQDIVGVLSILHQIPRRQGSWFQTENSLSSVPLDSLSYSLKSNAGFYQSRIWLHDTNDYIDTLSMGSKLGD